MAEKFEYELLDGKHPDLVKEELAIPIQYMVIVRPGVAWDEHYVSMVDDRCYITLDFKDYPIVKIGKEQAGIEAIYSNGGFNLSQLSDVFEKFPYLKHIKPEYLQAWAKENLLVVYHHSTPEELENGYAKIASEFMLMPMECAFYQGNSNFSYSPTVEQEESDDNVMTFGKAIKTCFAKAFDFTGRASRTEFWYFQLYQLLFFLVLCCLGLISIDEIDYIILETIGIIFIIVNFIPNLAVSYRRLLDAGRNPYLSLLPVIFGVISFFPNMERYEYYSMGAELMICIFACKPSVPIGVPYIEKR